MTAGNPLYLTELLRAVAEENGGLAAADSIQRAALPSLPESPRSRSLPAGGTGWAPR